MASELDFYKIPITIESFTAANFLAKIRIKYEYQRSGHNYIYNAPTNKLRQVGNLLNFRGTLSFGNIAFGILSEMLIYKDLTDYLHNNLKKDVSMIDKNFVYNFIIGKFDSGFDFIKDGIEIDIKHYSTHICKTSNEILSYNLLVDKKQFSNHQANLYIQTFTLIDNNIPYIVIGGYATKDMLVLNHRFKNPAYFCKVSDLLSYENLKNIYFQ
ncbi:hypothetical protein FIZ73_01675 [Campylobacter lari]|nr:hypothetical protein [Campylobacter lari]EBF6064485.1 hypothetical protein [Campylobacter lari]HEA6928498.1 hypothetical protein [Campylobacter lari]